MPFVAALPEHGKARMAQKPEPSFRKLDWIGGKYVSGFPNAVSGPRYIGSARSRFTFMPPPDGDGGGKRRGRGVGGGEGRLERGGGEGGTDRDRSLALSAFPDFPFPPHRLPREVLSLPGFAGQFAVF